MSDKARHGSGGRHVLVVGATGRLGIAIAQALVKRGDRVTLTARDERKLDVIAKELGNDTRWVCANLLDRDAIQTIAAGIREGNAPIDDVVLACGPFPRTPFDELRREDLEQTLAVHAVAPLLLVHALSGDLAKNEGSVVALGDAGTSRPYTNHVAYLTAKGALKTGLVALAAELAPRVRVNMVELGIVADPEADNDPSRHHRLATRSQLGRMGSPEEVVHVVLALLDATWVTGETWSIGR